jgi:hypothetical protein
MTDKVVQLALEESPVNPYKYLFLLIKCKVANCIEKATDFLPALHLQWANIQKHSHDLIGHKRFLSLCCQKFENQLESNDIVFIQ